MKFLCYSVYSGDPEIKDPISYCAMGEDGMLVSAITLEQLKMRISLDNSNSEFMEGCGWILAGEEQKLLSSECSDILKFWLLLREEKLRNKQTMGPKVK